MAGVAIVVFSDLVDSTALLASLGDDRMDAVRRAHVEDVTEAVTLGGGRVIKTLGDGVMSSFDSASARCVDLHARHGLGLRHRRRHFGRPARRNQRLRCRRPARNADRLDGSRGDEEAGGVAGLVAALGFAVATALSSIS